MMDNERLLWFIDAVRRLSKVGLPIIAAEVTVDRHETVYVYVNYGDGNYKCTYYTTDTWLGEEVRVNSRDENIVTIEDPGLKKAEKKLTELLEAYENVHTG